jgi:hypothetical protein
MRPIHPTDGIELIGSIQIAPPLSHDEIDLLDTIEIASFRAAVEHKPSALVDRLAPDHPDGPSSWVACPDGCCLEISTAGFAQVKAIEPWLAFLVGVQFKDHAFSGAMMFHDCADRTFSALCVEGSRVRRKPITLERATSPANRPRLVRSV